MAELLFSLTEWIVREAGWWLILAWGLLAAAFLAGVKVLRRGGDLKPIRLVEGLFPVRGRWLRRGLLPLYILLVAVPLGFLSGGTFLAAFACATNSLVGPGAMAGADLGMLLMTAGSLGGLLGALAFPAVSLYWLGYGRWSGVGAICAAAAFVGLCVWMSRGSSPGAVFAGGFMLPGVGSPFSWAGLLLLWGILTMFRRPRSAALPGTPGDPTLSLTRP